MEVFRQVCTGVCAVIIILILISGVLILVSDSYQRGLCEMDNNVYECVKIFVPKEISE